MKQHSARATFSNWQSVVDYLIALTKHNDEITDIHISKASKDDWTVVADKRDGGERRKTSGVGLHDLYW